MDIEHHITDPTATCPHVNATLTQWYVSANVFDVRAHGLDDLRRAKAIPTGMMSLWCHDCGLEVDYAPGRVPAGLQARVQVIIDELNADARVEGH